MVSPKRMEKTEVTSLVYSPAQVMLNHNMNSNMLPVLKRSDPNRTPFEIKRIHKNIQISMKPSIRMSQNIVEERRNARKKTYKNPSAVE